MHESLSTSTHFKFKPFPKIGQFVAVHVNAEVNTSSQSFTPGQSSVFGFLLIMDMAKTTDMVITINIKEENLKRGTNEMCCNFYYLRSKITLKYI